MILNKIICKKSHTKKIKLPPRYKKIKKNVFVAFYLKILIII